MTTEIMMWQVTEGKLAKLPARNFSSIHKEKDLEEWVESDPSILGKDLTVVGRQIYIPKVGPLDLLAVDQDGRLVVVEFKRQQTTRDSIAQILDYASSIRMMNMEQLISLANVDIGELSEITDFDPAMILVAADADESSERIVEYLVAKANLLIEVVTFTYATLADGQEIVARSILIPETLPALKAPPIRMNISDILRIAADRKVEVLVEAIRKAKSVEMGEEILPRRGGALRYWVYSIEGNERALFSIDVGGERLNSPEGALDLWFTPQTAADYTGLSLAKTWEALKSFNVVKTTPNRVFLRFTEIAGTDKLVALLNQWNMQNAEARSQNTAAV